MRDLLALVFTPRYLLACTLVFWGAAFLRWLEPMPSFAGPASLGWLLLVVLWWAFGHGGPFRRG